VGLNDLVSDSLVGGMSQVHQAEEHLLRQHRYTSPPSPSPPCHSNLTTSAWTRTSLVVLTMSRRGREGVQMSSRKHWHQKSERSSATWRCTSLTHDFVAPRAVVPRWLRRLLPPQALSYTGWHHIGGIPTTTKHWAPSLYMLCIHIIDCSYTWSTKKKRINWSSWLGRIAVVDCGEIANAEGHISSWLAEYPCIATSPKKS
jgi:hypothetical protein